MALNHFLQVPLTDAQIQSFEDAQGSFDHIENTNLTAIVQCDPTGPNIAALVNGANVFQARSVERFAEISEPGLSSVMRCAEDSVETYVGGNLRTQVVTNKIVMFDDVGAQRLVVSDQGVIVNNAYALPTTAGAAGTVLTSQGGNDTAFLPFTAAADRITNATDPGTEVTVQSPGFLFASVGLGKEVLEAAASPGSVTLKAPGVSAPALTLLATGDVFIDIPGAGQVANNVLVCSDNTGKATWGLPARIQDTGDPFNSFVWCDSDNINVSTNYPTGKLILKLADTPDVVPGQALTTIDNLGTCAWRSPQITGLFSQTNTVTVNSTAAETSMIGTGPGSVTVPANTMTAGAAYQYTSGGTFRTQGATSLRYRLRTNGVLLYDSGVLTVNSIATPIAWNIFCSFTYTGVNMVTNVTWSYNNGALVSGNTNQQVAAFNASVSNTLDFTVQWTVGNANNTINTNYGVITKVY